MIQDSENGKVLQTRNAKIKEKFELFDENPDDYDLEKKNFMDTTEKVIPLPKSSEDKLLSINNIIEQAVLTISGYEKEFRKQNIIFKQKKLPLTKNDVISTFHAILEPFGDVSNILSKKDWNSFCVQVESSWRAFYKFCIHSRAKPKTNTRTIYREFQTCLINIGDIVCENPENMKGFWNRLKSEYPEENVGGKMQYD